MNHSVQISILGSSYELKYGLKALFFYEELEGKPFEFTKLEDSYKLLHAALLAYNSNYSMSFDNLLEACDDDPEIFETFVRLTEESAKRNEQIKKKKKEEVKQ